MILCSIMQLITNSWCRLNQTLSVKVINIATAVGLQNAKEGVRIVERNTSINLKKVGIEVGLVKQNKLKSKKYTRVASPIYLTSGFLSLLTLIEDKRG